MLIFGVMRWQYKVSLFLMLLSQTVFLGLAAYYIDNQFAGYTWIWYHPEQWTFSLTIGLFGLAFFVYGIIAEIRESGWKLSDNIKIEILETEEDS